MILSPETCVFCNLGEEWCEKSYGAGMLVYISHVQYADKEERE